MRVCTYVALQVVVLLVQLAAAIVARRRLLELERSTTTAADKAVAPSALMRLQICVFQGPLSCYAMPWMPSEQPPAPQVHTQWHKGRQITFTSLIYDVDISLQNKCGLFLANSPE